MFDITLWEIVRAVWQEHGRTCVSVVWAILVLLMLPVVAGLMGR